MKTSKQTAIGALFLLTMVSSDPATTAQMDGAGMSSRPPASANGGSDASAMAGPATDRVGFPERYSSRYQLLSVSSRNQEPAVITVYANDRAASVTSVHELPYPDGSVIVMEWANTLKDSAGAPVRDSKGQPLKGEVVRVDVMRREQGFGEAYGPNRAGNWEFMSYRPDGSPLRTPAESAECAACHAKAGAAKDFVFRLRVPADGGKAASTGR